jgi:uracil-DNA glycosylase family 4
MGEGPSNPVGILVGEGPGREEREQGRPFVGSTGKQLDQELADAGLQRGRLFLVNATCCQPPPGRTAAQLEKAVKCCRPALAAQIKAQPQSLPIFAMGSAALKGISLKEDTSLDDVRGFINHAFPTAWVTTHPVIVSWHPTYAFFYNPYEWGAFSVDLHRFGRLIRGELRDPPKIVTQEKDGDAGVLKALRYLAGLPFVAIDIETKPAPDEEPGLGKPGYSAKFPTRAVFNLLGIGGEELAVSFKWALASKPVKDLALSIIEQPKRKRVYQNGYWYDRTVLVRHKVKAEVDDDTRDARRALSSTSPLDLGYMGSIYDDVHQWKAGKVFDKQEYNAYDCAVTARTMGAIWREPEWNTPRVQRLYSMHRKLSVITSEMHQVGVQVDQLQRSWMAWALQQEFEEKAAKLVKSVDVPGFRPTPNDLRAIIFKRHEKGALKRFSLPDPIDPSMYTNEERMDTISVDFDSLILLLIDPETPAELKHIIDLYWGALEIQKARSTFVTSAKISRAIGRDGRLRAGWNSCGTDTGRFSCSEPNLMNIEQDLRAYIIAAPGHILVHADYSQLELRVMAAVADDPVLQKFLNEGDVYSNDVRAFFGGEFVNMTDDQIKNGKGKAHRKSAKIIHLGSQYAAGTPTVFAQGLRQDRKLQYPATVMLHNAWKRTYQRTVRYWDEEMSRVSKAGYSESRILGRRRNYPRMPPITEVANYPIQATASDIANLALIDLDAKLKRYVPDAHVVIQLHDAFDVECKKKDEKTVRKIMQDVMEKPVIIEGREFHFPVEIKSSDRWSDL